MAKSIENHIFPELTPRFELFEKVNLIEKNWLDHSEIKFPEHIIPLVENFTFFKIKGRPAVFEENHNRLQAVGWAFNMFAALYNQAFPLVYMIHCRRGDISLLLGSNNPGAAGLAAHLETNLGPSLYEEGGKERHFPFDNYKYCSALTGIPHYIDRNKLPSREQPPREVSLDHLISGLLREEWVYFVQAFPIKREQVNIWFESCTREIKEIKETMLLKEVQKSNRMASFYVEILEKSVNRLKWGKQQGFWQTGVYLLSETQETVSRGAAILSSIFLGNNSTPETIRCHICSRKGSVSPFINCYHSKELNSFISLPDHEFSGFRLHEKIFFDVDFDSKGEKPIIIGQIMANDQVLDHLCSVPVNDLTKHALVAGVTGSGKTNTIFNLLKILNKTYDLPFLIIEPAKSEYRNLLKEIKNLLIFTMGEERPGVSAPFRLNPFSFPEGISLQTHIDYMKAVFNASFVMYAPMPYVLEDCLYKIYEDKGWNLVTSTNSRGKTEASFPTLADLYLKIDEVVENIGYQDRTTMDIKAALKTRIKNLCLGGKGMMLNTTSSIPFSEIMANPTVLELKYMGNDEEKTFMMGLILTTLVEYYESFYGRQDEAASGLRHLTVIEEAHRLLKNIPTEKTSEEQSNIKGKGVETFCNLLAEIRAYGEGVLVSEQIPSKLALDVVKNSNLKIMHRMVAKEDRELMGDTMNLDSHQKRQATCLGVGEAIFFREGLDRSIRIKIPLSEEKSRDDITNDAAVSGKMVRKFYDRHPSLLKKFVACNGCPTREKEQCELVKKEVEEVSIRQDMEQIGLKCFLPYLFEPKRGDFWKQLGALVNLRESSRYCLTAEIIHNYIQARGDNLGWPFAFIEKLVKEAQDSIETGDFAILIGNYLRENSIKTKQKYQFCDFYCRHQCLFGYEGRVVAKDPIMHNQLVDLLNGEERGEIFFKELAAMLLNSLRDYLPADQEQFLDDLAFCYLIHKLNELRFSLPLQGKIMKEFICFLKKRSA